jgi:SAM-dependent methyltransferase
MAIDSASEDGSAIADTMSSPDSTGTSGGAGSAAPPQGAGLSAEALVFAPDTLVRFRRGNILIHTTSSAVAAFETGSPMLVGWLSQFARPTRAAAALLQLQEGDRGGAAQVLDYLCRSGALTTAQSVSDASEPSERETEARTRQHLALLTRSVYEAACDLHGFGPYAERQLSERTGIGVERRLMALLASVDGLRQELKALRESYLGEQLAALGVGATSRELKLHIGCGRGHIPGWIDIDIFPAPLALNILWGTPFGADSARYVFVSHLLEHLFYPRDVTAFLAELLRVLAPGGIVRLVVPDIGKCIEAYAGNDETFFRSRRETWSWWPENPTRLEDFLAYAGAGPEPAYLLESHKYGYDLDTLTKVLQEAGFVAIEASTYMGSAHEALRVDDKSAVASAKYGERYYSLFVEARKPG